MTLGEPNPSSGEPDEPPKVSLGLKQLFGAEDDELAVLSVCAARTDTQNGWVLAHGTLLVVPEACGGVSWPEWMHQQGARHSPGVDPPLEPSLSSHGENWLLARQVCSTTEAKEWLAEFWGRHAVDAVTVLPKLGHVPELQARLEMPKALAQVVPSVDSPCSSLITGLGRPAQALMWASPSAPAVGLPDRIDADGRWSFMPSIDFSGMHLTQDWVDPKMATAKGLLVGRAERRAWLRDSRGESEFKHYIVELGWDPGRIEISDLEITHIECMNLDTVLAIRIRLEDLEIADVAAAGSVAIELPTLGRNVTHELMLSTIDGELLDRSGPHPIVERLEVAMEINGERLPPIISGISDPPPNLQVRIERRDEVQAELQEIIENAAQAGILADRSVAIERLTALLERARGELLVMDPFFGQDPGDWRLLDGVKIPVRALTAKLAQDSAGEVLRVTLGPNVQARFRRKAPFHDRIYVWDGGGLSVGGSPTTFGQAPLRLARLGTSEVDLWRGQFETLWHSPHFHPVPRADLAG
jgi:hypothetical protein